MQTKKLNIVLFDGSLKTTPFINRLAAGLAQNHRVTILGFSNSLPNRLPGVHYVSLGSDSKPFHLFLRSIEIGLKYLFKRGALGSWVRTKINLMLLRKNQLKAQNFKATMALLQPDILHVQWPSLLPWLEHHSLAKTKVVLSQRGYQTNVRPFIDTANMDYLRKMYPKMAGFHSVSKAISERGDLIYNHPSKIDKVVYSGFDLERLEYNKAYKKENHLEIVSVGRPHWIKGYNYAIKAFGLLKKKNIKFTYTIVGAAGNEELMYMLDNLNLKVEVRLLPKISQDEVYRLVRKSQLFLMPSIEEGLPNVLVEAMAIGIPVVATNCGGVKDLITPGLGKLIPPRDAKSMAAAIVDFTNRTESDIDAQRQRAREKVETQHSTQKMVTDMEALYLKCMESVSD